MNAVICGRGPVIDTHHHFLPQALVDELDGFVPEHVVVHRTGTHVVLQRRSDGFNYTTIDPRHWCDAERQIAAMDECGVDHALLSIACFSDWLTPQAATLYNDGLAEVISRHPTRFSAVIAVCPDDEVRGRDEIERRVAVPGFVAVSLTTNYLGKYPDHPSIRWVFDAAAAVSLPVFLHPSFNPPQSFAEGGLRGWDLERTLGKVTDLTLAVARLLYAGVLDPPGARVVAAHLGGSLPLVKRRLFLGPATYGAMPTKDYASLLERVWVDTAPGIYQGPAEIAFTAGQLGPDRILFGSDYPVTAEPMDMLKQSVEHVRMLADTGLQKAILADNAAGGFPRLRLTMTGGEDAAKLDGRVRRDFAATAGDTHST